MVSVEIFSSEEAAAEMAILKDSWTLGVVGDVKPFKRMAILRVVMVVGWVCFDDIACSDISALL